MFSYTRAAHKLLVTHTCTCGCAVLLCLVCLTLLASFFLPSHLSFKNMYSKHQKKLPVLQNGTDSFVVENGRRTDTKRIAHGYRKERPVPFCFPFRSVYFLFVRFIAFHSVHHVRAATVKIQPFALFPDLRRDAQRYPWPSAVQPSCERFE